MDGFEDYVISIHLNFSERKNKRIHIVSRFKRAGNTTLFGNDGSNDIHGREDTVRIKETIVFAIGSSMFWNLLLIKS
jgi:hypothetical protein